MSPIPGWRGWTILFPSSCWSVNHLLGMKKIALWYNLFIHLLCVDEFIDSYYAITQIHFPLNPQDAWICLRHSWLPLFFLAFLFSFFFFWHDFNLLVLLGSLLLFSHYVTCGSFAAPWTVARQAPLCSQDFLGKNTGVGCHFLLQGIFLTQGSNPCLLHWQADSSPLSHQGSPLLGKQINRKKQVTCKFCSDILKMQVNDRGLWSWLCNGRGRVPLCPPVSPTVAHRSQL